ncbi:MAG: TonB-dependent receptor [Pseudomonadota bacterium]
MAATLDARTREGARRLLCTWLLCSGGLCLTTTALAQAGAEGSRPRIEEIVVYGEKRTLNLQDTPTSIGVVSSDTIEDTGVLDFQEATRLLANVRDGAGLENGFVIRGINSEGTGVADGGAPLASLYIDGVIQSPGGARRGARGLWDVQQVEVLRGPQSTISGRNMLAGSIQIRSKDPTFDGSGTARVSVDDRDFLEVAVAQSITLVDEQLAARIALQGFENSTNVEFVNLPTARRPDLGEYAQGRLKLLYEPTALPRLRVLYTGSVSSDEPGTNTVFQTSDIDFFDRINLGRFEFRETQVLNQALTITYDLNDAWTLTAETTSADDETDRAFFLQQNGEIVQGTDGTIAYQNVAQELRANYEGKNSRTSAIVGVYLFREELLNDTTVLGNLRFGADLVERNRAVFGQVTFGVSKRLALIVGGRWDSSDTEGTLIGGTVSEPEPEPVPDADFSVLIPSLGFLYDLTDNVALGGTARSGFRAGGSGRNLAGVYEYDPETTFNYELALRSTWFDDALRVNANVFFTDWRDQQITVQLSPLAGDQIVENAGRSELAGAELEIDYAASDALTIGASLGVLETRITAVSSTNRSVGLSAGDAFREAPAVSASLRARYVLPQGWFFSADGEYSDSYFSLIPNLPMTRIDEYIVANARVGFAWDGGRVALQVDNLLDEDYLLSVDEFGVGVVGNQRTIGLTATFNW